MANIIVESYDKIRYEGDYDSGFKVYYLSGDCTICGLSVHTAKDCLNSRRKISGKELIYLLQQTVDNSPKFWIYHEENDIKIVGDKDNDPYVTKDSMLVIYGVDEVKKFIPKLIKDYT